MAYPVIKTIDDVLPHVEGRRDFVVADKGDYTVIDYVYQEDDTFDHPMRLECRGLKFAPDGKIMARPLHKFFNLGEKEDLQEHHFDTSGPHTVLKKLDGSMVHGALVNDEFVLMTRMGYTDVEKKAERHLTDAIKETGKEMLERGMTPIFEWTAPDNQIVVKYDESKLTLLHMRDNETGRYINRMAAKTWAEAMAVDMVEAVPNATNRYQFIKDARSLENEEGYIVRLGPYHYSPWFKIKADAYVRKHRAKDALQHEKNVLRVILNNELDDLLPLLDADEKARVEQYAADVNAGIRDSADFIDRLVRKNEEMPQKEFAEHVNKHQHPLARPIIFKVRAHKQDYADRIIRETILKNTGSQTRVDQYRDLHEAVYHAA